MKMGEQERVSPSWLDFQDISFKEFCEFWTLRSPLRNRDISLSFYHSHSITFGNKCKWDRKEDLKYLEGYGYSPSKDQFLKRGWNIATNIKCEQKCPEIVWIVEDIVLRERKSLLKPTFFSRLRGKMNLLRTLKANFAIFGRAQNI